jgi:hypothetical protein
MKKYTLSVAYIALFTGMGMPIVAYAAPATFAGLMEMIVGWVSVAVPVIVGLALFAFLYGLALFLKNSGDSKQHGEGATIMTYGIISLFVIVALWGLVEMARRSIFGDDSTAVPSSSSILNSFDLD